MVFWKDNSPGGSVGNIKVMVSRLILTTTAAQVAVDACVVVYERGKKKLVYGKVSAGVPTIA